MFHFTRLEITSPKLRVLALLFIDATNPQGVAYQMDISLEVRK